MFKFFQSNDMHQLTELFCARMPSSTGDPFVPATVLVQSYGTGQWLKLKCAERDGIAANIDCVLPAHFIWQLYRKLLDAPERSPFQSESLAFRLMPILARQPDPAIQGYLNHDGDADLRCYQLGEKLAGLFEQYLLYRPDWMAAWEKQEDIPFEHPFGWQKTVWQDLLASDPTLARQHRGRLHLELMELIARPHPAIPGAVSVFGISSLSPMQIQTLAALSAHCEVDIYFLNPCQHYWGDIVSKSDQSRRSIRDLVNTTEALEDDDYLEVGNPLLASLGKQGREFLELVLENDTAHDFESFNESLPESALGQIHQDILNLEVGGQYGDDSGRTPAVLRPDDRSVEFHSCHNKQRELEVLLDQLLHLFATTDTAPADVIVMTPSVADYAPFIHGIFHGKVPYTIADRSLVEQSDLVSSLVQLLNLPDSRLTSIEVMDLLEVPSIAKKLGINQDQRELIAAWIEQAGIRWETDGQSKSNRWDLPDVHQNTWRFGLDRLLLGVAMDSQHGTYRGIYPADVTAGDAALLGNLIGFINQLERYRTLLSDAHIPGEWHTLVSDLLDDFFEPTGDEILEIEQLQKQLQQFTDMTELANYDTPVSSQLFRYWLRSQLSQTNTAANFLSGGVTFATLVPMRSIPFNTVCLIGMNDGAFPRQDKPVSFDLMARFPRQGDRSRRLDDRYLFLEAILSAREYLYVSYEGKSMKDNEDRPPSVVVSELIDYCRDVFDRVNFTDHPLQPFSPRYFDGSLVTYQRYWFDAITVPSDYKGFRDTQLLSHEVQENVNLTELQSFFKHTARYYLRSRLGVYLSDSEVDLRDVESFSLDSLENYTLADSALQCLVTGHSLDRWRENQVASGTVMQGSLGTGQLLRAETLARNLHEQLTPLLVENLAPLQVQAEVGDITITGRLDLAGENLALYYRAGNLSARHQVEAWLAHLFANAAGHNLRTEVVTRNRDSILTGRFQPLEANDASQALAPLLAIFERAQQEAVCLPPETLLALYNKLAKDGDRQAAIDAAVKTWEQDNKFEGTDREWQRVFTIPEDIDDQVIADTRALYTALLDHWEQDK